MAVHLTVQILMTYRHKNQSILPVMAWSQTSINVCTLGV